MLDHGRPGLCGALNCAALCDADGVLYQWRARSLVVVWHVCGAVVVWPAAVDVAGLVLVDGWIVFGLEFRFCDLMKSSRVRARD